MPELERWIEAWRASLAGTAAGRPEVAEELEGHLREDVRRLLGAGESERRAWELALARLGNPAALAGEFAKVPLAPAPWLPVWVAAGVAYVLTVGLAWALGMRFQAGGMGALLLLHVAAVTVGYSATFLAGFLAVCYVAARPFRDLSAGQARFLSRALLVVHGLAFALSAAGVVLGGFWARDHLGRFWGWDSRETAALLLLAWDLALVAYWWRRPVADRSGVLLGLVGNVVVSLAWVGPALLGGGAHGYGRQEWTILLLLGGFVLAQPALFAAGFAPPGWLRARAARG
jgi:hypothetical protein